MLAYRGLGDTAAAARHEALFRRFKADECAQTITGAYRQLTPKTTTSASRSTSTGRGAPRRAAGYGGSR